MFGWTYPQNVVSMPVEHYGTTIWNNASTFSGTVTAANVTHHTYYSSVMQRTIGYCIYLPATYPAAAPYNVIYHLCTGGSDENGEVDAAMTHYGTSPSCIIVFVNGGRESKYKDSISGATLYNVVMMDTSFKNELVPTIDQHYQTNATRTGRALTGFSQGGKGTLRFVYKYPEMFGCAYAYVASDVDHTESISSNAFADMFNSNATAWDNDRCVILGAANAASIRSYAPAIKLVVGAWDALLPENQALDSMMTSNTITHTYVELTGGSGHSQSNYWSREGGHLDLDYMLANMS